MVYEVGCLRSENRISESDLAYWQEIESRIVFEYNLNNVIVTCKCCHNDQMAP